MFGQPPSGDLDTGWQYRKAAKKRLKDLHIVVKCTMCKRVLADTPSYYFSCPWCQTKLYNPIEVVELATSSRRHLVPAGQTDVEPLIDSQLSQLIELEYGDPNEQS